MYASVPRLAVPDYYTAIIMIVPHVHGLEINNQASNNILAKTFSFVMKPIEFGGRLLGRVMDGFASAAAWAIPGAVAGWVKTRIDKKNGVESNALHNMAGGAAVTVLGVGAVKASLGVADETLKTAQGAVKGSTEFVTEHVDKVLSPGQTPQTSPATPETLGKS